MSLHQVLGIFEDLRAERARGLGFLRRRGSPLTVHPALVEAHGGIVACEAPQGQHANIDEQGLTAFLPVAARNRCMEKELFVVQFSNGIDRRSVPTLQPDAIFAAMYGQREAPYVFGERWNSVADKRKWKIVVLPIRRRQASGKLR
jgi:hypothetical protein